MIALSVLVLLLTTITVACFLVDKKKVLTPSFIFDLTLLASSIVGWIGNLALWREDVSFVTVAIVIASVIMFDTGDFLIRHLLLRRAKKKQNEGPKSSLKQYEDYGSPAKKKFITKRVLIGLLIVFAFGFFAVVLVFYFRVQQAIEYGYRPPSLDLLKYLRKAILADSKIPSVASRLGEVAEGIGLVAVFVFFYVFFRSSKKRESLWVLLLVLPTIGIMLLSSARTGFIFLAVDAAVSFIINVKTAGCQIGRRFIFGFFGVVLGLFTFLFVGIGILRGSILSVSGISGSVMYYFGGSVIAFDKFLRGWDFSHTTPFAANSFCGVYELLHRFFPDIAEPMYFEAFVHFANGQSTNVFTIMKAFVEDFGVVANFVLMTVLGIAYGTVYHIVSQQRKGFSFWYIYFALLVFYLILSAISKLATSTLFMWRRISYVLVILGASEGVRLLLYGKEDFVFIHKLRNSNSVKTNLLFSFVGQFVVLASSLFIAFFFPKVMGKDTDFASWQYFILLTGFVGFFHFGFCDGLYLRLGGKKAEELSEDRLPQHTKLFFGLETLVVAILIAIGCAIWMSGEQKGLLLVCTAVYLWVYNLFTYCGYVFQATNQIKKYSVALIINKGLFLASSAILLALKVSSFLPYICIYIGGTLLSLIVLLILGRKIFFQRRSRISRSLIREFISITGKGIWIMVGSLSGSLILASSKYIAEWCWGASTFSEVAYCFTLMAVFMAFVSQVCIVAFPVLRRKSPKDAAAIKSDMDRAISLFVPPLLLFYYPAFFLIRLWLPQFEASLYYLGLILPIIIFEIKTQLLCTTYFKMLNKEKPFFIINVSSLAISFALGMVSAFVLNSTMALVLSACLGVVVQSVVGQIVISKLTETKISPFILTDIAVFAVFGLTNYFFPWWGGLLACAGYLVIFYLCAHKDLIAAVKQATSGRHMKHSSGEEAVTVKTTDTNPQA